MKKFIKYLFIVILLMAHSGLHAQWYNETNHNFRVQKDVDATMSADYTRNMCTVSYHDTLFNFVNYRATGATSITVRKIFHNKKAPNFTWDYEKSEVNFPQDFSLEEEDWQPAAVVFRDSLLLFYMTENRYNNYGISYSLYHPSTGKWKFMDFVKIGSNFWAEKSHGMAAVVMDSMLCLITHDYDERVKIRYTYDLKNWYTHNTDIILPNSSGENDVISATTVPITLNSQKRTKLVFAWINEYDHPYTAEYIYNDNSNNWNRLRMMRIGDTEYSSVALATGTISCPDGSREDCVPDPTSSGNCVQAFVKKKEQDNHHRYHRIKRFQLAETDTTWLKIEDNLVPMNDPKHYWASREIPLTATVLPIAYGKDIRQFMCLVYRCYDNWEFPMNVAWAETDRLVYQSQSSEVLQDPAFTQYIGYIEGPPPFYLNHLPLDHPYRSDGNDKNISTLEFKSSISTEVDKKVSVENKFTSKNKIGRFSLNVSNLFGKIWHDEYTITKEHAIEPEAGELALGYYLKLQPKVIRAYYHLNDVQGKLLNKTYYFFMGEPQYENTAKKLIDVNPSDPFTYTDSLRTIYWEFYPHQVVDVSWAMQAPATGSIKLDEAHSKSTIRKESVSIGLEHDVAEIFKIEVENESSFEWEMTTKTTAQNEFTAKTNLNSPLDEKDGEVSELNYNVYWLYPSDTEPNWWLHKGGEDQQTWCITYEVTKITTNGGVQYNRPPDEKETKKTYSSQTNQVETGNQPENKKAGQVSSIGFSLSQNYPNPFSGNTKIKYEIGIADVQNESSWKGIPTKLLVYGMAGNLVATLVNEVKEPGYYEVNWNASDLQPGMYFYSLQAGTYRNVKKLIVIK